MKRRQETVRDIPREAKKWIGAQASDGVITLSPGAASVYILWDENSENPLYVGYSRNVCMRVGSHLAKSSIRQRVARIDVVPCTNDYTARRTEELLIALLQPQLNIRGVGDAWAG